MPFVQNGQVSAVYQAQQIRELERLAATAGLPGDVLMQRAGMAAFAALMQRWSTAQTVVVLCGTGHNGGDGLVLAKLVAAAGKKVIIWCVGEQQRLQNLILAASHACAALNIPIYPWDEQQPLQGDVIIDALLGIGLHGAVEGVYLAAIQAINRTNIPVLALDVPSGLNADTGVVGTAAVVATLTITFIGLKLGLLTADGPVYCGDLICATLDLPVAITQQVAVAGQCLTWEHWQHVLPPRAKNSHKGHFGHVLIVGGDYGMAGAVRLAGEAAGRVGAGLVSVATRPEHVGAMNMARPELMCYGITSAEDMQALLKKATVIVVGPGLGSSTWSDMLMRAVLSVDQPKILDADALNWLTHHRLYAKNWILTPHPGEAARLLATTTDRIQTDRLTALRLLQERYGGICVLKGTGTLIVANTVIPAVCIAGNPGMATAGMGDVLSGVLGGLVAQGLILADAAYLGVLLHSYAADRAAKKGERGMLALDLMSELRRLVNPIFN